MESGRSANGEKEQQRMAPVSLVTPFRQVMALASHPEFVTRYAG